MAFRERASFGLAGGLLGFRRHLLNEDAIIGSNAFTASGLLRITNGIALVSENYIMFEDVRESTFSYGIRIIGEKTALSIAFFPNVRRDLETFIGFPYFDFVVRL